ncbi:MAG: putative multi-sensor signal transduction histidine kinase [Actinomycetia bacterium]|nr:putative multi-sensor signal transduction histidine kinase [Actinomycetes bacterium]
MAEQLAVLANLVITAAYSAIMVAILVPVAKAGQLRTNRLATTTGLIFLSCAVGHGFHAFYALAQLRDGAAVTHPGHGSATAWPPVIWDLLTAVVGVYYWTLRRNYGVLLGQGALFSDPGEVRRLHEIDLREQIAASRATAEAERDAHAAMLRSVIANSQSLIYVKDLDGHYLLVNDAFEAAFTVREKDLLGRTDEFLDPALAPVWRASDERALTGPSRSEEVADLAGGRRVYEVVKFPLYDPAGQLFATCGIALDVTDLREATRTAEEARDEAVAQSQVKSQFMATMSHEIRTPMNGVIGLANLLLASDLDPGQRRYTASILTAGNALLTVINDILDFSKVEAGKLVLEEEPFSLPGLIAEVAELVTPSAQDKGLALVTRRSPGLPATACGDPGRLRQVLLNLASNAVKFTEHGSVTIRAELAEPITALDGPVTIRFEVTDTGIGVDPHDAERLFEPFAQADASTTRTYGGTGLGLAISRQLTEAMGGRIGVDSEPGQGSTFWCTIPLGQPAASAPAVRPAATRLGIAGLRVLLVDPAPTRVVLEDRLVRWKMDPSSVATDDAAMRSLREAGQRGRPFDLVIVDADSAGADPLGLSRRIHDDSEIPALQVVSLHWEPGDSAAATAAGISAQLAKPVRQSQLYDCLAQAMAPDPPVSRATPAPVPAAGRRILLVEDNEINQLVATGILGQLGYTPDIACDGIEALELTARTDYDVVLMDCQMPRMDGFTATAELRLRDAERGRRHTPIIALTASALVADRDRCLAAGMDDYVTKPVDSAELQAALARWTAQDSAAARAESGDPLARRIRELLGRDTATDRDLVGRLIRSFLKGLPGHLDSIADAVAQADPARAGQHAHTLRGAAANIGATAIAETCQRIESMARDGSAGATAELPRLRDEIQTASAQLQAYLTP